MEATFQILLLWNITEDLRNQRTESLGKKLKVSTSPRHIQIQVLEETSQSSINLKAWIMNLKIL